MYPTTQPAPAPAAYSYSAYPSPYPYPYYSPYANMTSSQTPSRAPSAAAPTALHTTAAATPQQYIPHPYAYHTPAAYARMTYPYTAPAAAQSGSASNTQPATVTPAAYPSSFAQYRTPLHNPYTSPMPMYAPPAAALSGQAAAVAPAASLPAAAAAAAPASASPLPPPIAGTPALQLAQFFSAYPPAVSQPIAIHEEKEESGGFSPRTKAPPHTLTILKAKIRSTESTLRHMTQAGSPPHSPERLRKQQQQKSMPNLHGGADAALSPAQQLRATVKQSAAQLAEYGIKAELGPTPAETPEPNLAAAQQQQSQSDAATADQADKNEIALIMRISLDSGQVDLEVPKGSVPLELAKQFCAEHQLDDDKVESLANYIQLHLDAIKEEEEEANKAAGVQTEQQDGAQVDAAEESALPEHMRGVDPLADTEEDRKRREELRRMHERYEELVRNAEKNIIEARASLTKQQEKNTPKKVLLQQQIHANMSGTASSTTLNSARKKAGTSRTGRSRNAAGRDSATPSAGTRSSSVRPTSRRGSAREANSDAGELMSATLYRGNDTMSGSQRLQKLHDDYARQLEHVKRLREQREKEEAEQLDYKFKLGHKSQVLASLKSDNRNVSERLYEAGLRAMQEREQLSAKLQAIKAEREEREAKELTFHPQIRKVNHKITRRPWLERMDATGEEKQKKKEELEKRKEVEEVNYPYQPKLNPVSVALASERIKDDMELSSKQRMWKVHGKHCTKHGVAIVDGVPIPVTENISNPNGPPLLAEETKDGHWRSTVQNWLYGDEEGAMEFKQERLRDKAERKQRIDEFMQRTQMFVQVKKQREAELVDKHTSGFYRIDPDSGQKFWQPYFTPLIHEDGLPKDYDLKRVYFAKTSTNTWFPDESSQSKILNEVKALTNIPKTSANSEQILQQRKRERALQIFMILDQDQDGYIDETAQLIIHLLPEVDQAITIALFKRLNNTYARVSTLNQTGVAPVVPESPAVAHGVPITPYKHPDLSVVGDSHLTQTLFSEDGQPIPSPIAQQSQLLASPTGSTMSQYYGWRLSFEQFATLLYKELSAQIKEHGITDVFNNALPVRKTRREGERSRHGCVHGEGTFTASRTSSRTRTSVSRSISRNRGSLFDSTSVYSSRSVSPAMHHSLSTPALHSHSHSNSRSPTRQRRSPFLVTPVEPQPTATPRLTLVDLADTPLPLSPSEFTFKPTINETSQKLARRVESRDSALLASPSAAVTAQMNNISIHEELYRQARQKTALTETYQQQHSQQQIAAIPFEPVPAPH